MTYQRKIFDRDVGKDHRTLCLMSEGKSRKQIAAALCMSIGKLSYRVIRLKQELGAATDAHLVAQAFRKGLIQ